MRRGIGAIALVVVIMAGVAIGVGAYRAGERNGVAEGIEQVQVAQENGRDVQVVHVVGEGRGWFFPGFFLFPLFLIGGIFLIRGLVFGAGRFGRGRPHGYGPGPWNEEGRRGSRSGPVSGTSASTAVRRPIPPRPRPPRLPDRGTKGAEARLPPPPSAREARSHAAHPGRRGRDADRA